PQFNHTSVQPSYPYQSQMNHQTSFVSQIAYQSPQVSTQPMIESPLVDLGFADLIACLNKAMAFLTTVASSRVIVKQVPGRQGQSYSGTSYKSNATSSGGNNASGQARTEDLDTYDSECDGISNAKAVLMANISNYGSDVISEANVQDANLQAQQDLMILSVIKQMSEQMINHVNNCRKANKEHNNELVTAELERYKERVKTFKQHLNIDFSSREKMIDF
nr:hypothetical protein [Tanacetum cinerariifolium]